MDWAVNPKNRRVPGDVIFCGQLGRWRLKGNALVVLLATNCQKNSGHASNLHLEGVSNSLFGQTKVFPIPDIWPPCKAWLESRGRAQSKGVEKLLRNVHTEVG